MPSSNLPLRKTGQITHVPPPSRDITQNTVYPRHVSKANGGLESCAGAETLRTPVLSSVYSTAEYCAPAWCRSAHTRNIDSVLNDALCIVAGCLRSTPTDHLPTFSSIQPVELRCLGVTLSLAKRVTLDPDHILHGQPAGSPNSPQEGLNPRHQFVPAAGKLLNGLSELGIRVAQCTNFRWRY